MKRLLAIIGFAMLSQVIAKPKPALTPQAEGFRGIWFGLGQKSEYGDKYSGGLGTYTANHVPMAHQPPFPRPPVRTIGSFRGLPQKAKS